jgi:hypothetical protein
VTESGSIPVFFRDHHLSDLIGFEYSRWDAHDAANNFVHNIKKIYDRLASMPSGTSVNEHIVPIILDGENAWEYFHDSGVTFLNILFSKLGQLGSNIEFTTLSNALEGIGEVRALPVVPTGSWIDGTFNIWIGHQEDHAAWEMLSRARALLDSREKTSSREGNADRLSLERALEYLMVAEGSDWCWWYGDDHYTPHGPEFDRLFRNNIKAAYKEMGVIPPDSIDIPIIRSERVVQKERDPAPSVFNPGSTAKCHPIPNRLGDEDCSCACVRLMPSGRSSALVLFLVTVSAWMKSFPIRPDNVAVENVRNRTRICSAENRQIHSNLDLMNRRFNHSLVKIGEAGGRTSSSEDSSMRTGTVRAAYGKVLELAIPIDALDCRNDERLEFFVTIQIAESFGERWPIYGTFSAELPGKDFAERMWQFEMFGGLIPRKAEKKPGTFY